MILFINTADLENISLALIDGSDIRETRTRVSYNENDKTLTLLAHFLEKQEVKLKDISEILVCSGPGSFTGVRVGVTLAKSIGFAMNIPVRGIAKEHIPTELANLSSAVKQEKLEVLYNRPPF